MRWIIYEVNKSNKRNRKPKIIKLKWKNDPKNKKQSD